MGVMRVASIVVGVIVALYSMLLLFQVWGSGVSADIFVKITISALVLVVVIFGLAVLYREYVLEKKMHDEGYLD